jgi:molybdopterin-guanine dinucleotide biosynthesis protein A
MDAIVTAGGTPQPGEPLYEFTQGQPKAMLDICGKPMIQWVLDALTGSSQVDQIIVIGLNPDAGITCPKVVDYLPNQGGMLQNVRLGMKRSQEINPTSHHLLFASSDVPAITPEIVDWLITTSMQTDLDAYYTVVTRQVMETRYPNSRRSYTRLKDIEVCGGDIHIVRSQIGPENDAMWEKLVAARKNVFKQASLIGYDTLFLLLFHAITLEKAIKVVTNRLHITGLPLICPFAEAGMDVDKPFQLEIVRSDLAQRIAS